MLNDASENDAQELVQLLLISDLSINHVVEEIIRLSLDTKMLMINVALIIGEIPRGSELIMADFFLEISAYLIRLSSYCQQPYIHKEKAYIRSQSVDLSYIL